MTRSNVQLGGQELKLDADGDTSIQVSTDDVLVIDTAGSERMRVDASGNILFNKTALNNTDTGARFNVGGDASFVKDGVVTKENKANGEHKDMEIGDPVYQTVAYSDNELITRLVGAVQELSAKNDALEARIKKLEDG